MLRPPRPAALAVLALLAAVPSLARADAPGVVARVDGVPITEERLERFFEDYLAERGRGAAAIPAPEAHAALRRQALERLIDAELLWQEARRREISASDAEVSAALAEVRGGFLAPGGFERRLARSGFTAESYAEYLRRQLAIRKLVQREVVARIAVDDAEIEAYLRGDAARLARTEGEGGAAGVRDAVRHMLAARKAREALARRVEALRARSRIEIAPTP